MERATTHAGTEEGAREAAAKELVSDVCHEIGNLLAGTRLEASLLDPDAAADTLKSTAARIESASARAGALLALIRPILETDSLRVGPVDPLDVLAGLRSGLDAGIDARVAVDFKSAVDLPAVRLPSEPLHHLLICAIYCGLESAGEGSGVRIRAEGRDASVDFAVDLDRSEERRVGKEC